MEPAEANGAGDRARDGDEARAAGCAKSEREVRPGNRRAQSKSAIEEREQARAARVADRAGVCTLLSETSSASTPRLPEHAREGASVHECARAHGQLRTSPRADAHTCTLRELGRTRANRVVRALLDGKLFQLQRHGRRLAQGVHRRRGRVERAHACRGHGPLAPCLPQGMAGAPSHAPPHSLGLAGASTRAWHNFSLFSLESFWAGSGLSEHRAQHGKTFYLQRASSFLPSRRHLD
eukprot:509869-Pleurochrysis_carterae.AAC.1